MPKDILPLLSKDEEKQKAIEAKAAVAAEDAKRRASEAAVKSPTPNAKKIAMKIPEIPPWKPKATPPTPQAPSIVVPESATRDIPQAVSPTPSGTSQASQSLAAKLNPKASSFVFKPNPSAAAFKPVSNGVRKPTMMLMFRVNPLLPRLLHLLRRLPIARLLVLLLYQ